MLRGKRAMNKEQIKLKIPYYKYHVCYFKYDPDSSDNRFFFDYETKDEFVKDLLKKKEDGYDLLSFSIPTHYLEIEY